MSRAGGLRAGKRGRVGGRRKKGERVITPWARRPEGTVLVSKRIHPHYTVLTQLVHTILHAKEFHTERGSVRFSTL